MHAVEGADCSVRSLRVQRARAQGEREREKEMEVTERMAVPLKGGGVGLERGAVDSVVD